MELQGAHARISVHIFHGLEGGNISSVVRVTNKSKDRQMQLDLAKCAPTVTLISRTFLWNQIPR